MAQWSPWDTPKSAVSPFNSRKVKATFERRSPFAAEDRLDFAADKTVTPGWHLESNSFNGHNGKFATSNNRIIMPSETSPSSDGADPAPSEFYTRFSQMKELDKYKNDLFDEILCRYQYVSERYAQLSTDHERECEYNRIAQRREKTFQENIRRLQTHLDSDPFILVLLDGDAMVFQDELLEQGLSGGQQAAVMLRDAVWSHVAEALPDLPMDLRIVTRVYANFKSFGDIYHNASAVNHHHFNISDFALGFMQGVTDFDFVDVGNVTDLASAKILATLKLHLRDFHCRQILLGCSDDNAYMQLLNEHVTDDKFLNKVTLLEGFPFEDEIRNLPFETAKFNGIFQTSRLDVHEHFLSSMLQDARVDSPFSSPIPSVGRQLSQMNFKDIKEFTPRALPAARAAEIASESPKPSPSLKWASIAARAVPAPSPSPQPVAITGIGMSQPPRNRKGQRVDPIIKHDKAEVDRVKKLKMCNVHYLRGECPYGDNCTHIHTYKPTAAEIQTLRLVARMAPCMNGSDCDEVKCIYGHICPAPEGRDGKDCIFGEACRFPIDLHKIDRQIVKTIKV